jgi:deoxyadenosine/deoxycytidine kinase
MEFMPVIWVEGGIANGKSVLSSEVAKRLGLRVLEEPVEKNKLLEAFYENPKEHAFGLQISMMFHRHAQQQIASWEATGVGGAKGVILDRSIAGDRVFAKMHMECGNIHPLHWEAYERGYQIMARNLLPPTLIVYLDCQPETAFARVNKRNRGIESGITLDYLVRLRKGYQELLDEARRGFMPWGHAVRVLSLCWDYDTVTETQWDAIANTIQEACSRR